MHQKLTTISGMPPRFLMPPKFKFSFSFSLLIFNNSFLERLRLEFLSERSISSSSSFFIEIEIVFQLVKVPPNHLLFTKHCCVSIAKFSTILKLVF